LNTSLSQSIDAPMKDLFASAGVSIENLVIAPAMRSEATHPFCRLLEDVMARRAIRGAPFATDGGHFQRLGLQTYVCGPGLLSQAHQPNESIPVANFISGTDRLHQVITRWCMA
jgi:acetylornithine deacetylase